MNKVCSICSEEKPLSEFYNRAGSKDGRRADCKACVYRRNKTWAAANPEKNRQIKLASVKRFQSRRRAHYLACKRRYESARRENPGIQLSRRVSTAMREALKGTKNGRSWCEIVGYTLDELRTHLERQFLKGMSWENMSEWHIDHIVPLSSFTISGPDDPELRRAWGLPNLRPLWAPDNVRKHAKMVSLL